jgi:hypothetical protein
MARAKQSKAAPAASAMAAGDGPAFVAAVANKKPETLKKLGERADVTRWDVRVGRCLLGAAEFLLAQPDDVIRDFLPTLAIAAAREHHYKAAASRAAAEAVLARLRPFVERSAWAADLIARSGCHYIRVHDGRAEARDLLELARACPAMKNNEWFAKLKQELA